MSFWKYIFWSWSVNKLKLVWLVQFIIIVLLTHFNLTEDEITAGAVDTLEKTHGKIIHASVFFRHGERTPTAMYPTDPYPTTLWPEGLGQITKEGKLKLYHVGKWFRKRYFDVGLKEGYHYDKLLMNSSLHDRAMMSAEVFLAGLLPPNAEEMWADDNLRWQPIPVHVNPQDPVVGIELPCDKYDLEKYNANQSPELQTYYQKNQKFLEFLAQHSGYNISSSDVLSALLTLAHIYNSFGIEKNMNLSLPTWSTSVYPEPLTSMYSMFLVSLSITPEMKRLRAGPALSIIISDMLRKRSGSYNQTFHFYSGHDSNMVALLLTLGLYDNIPPPYGASIMFELRLKDDAYIVTIMYRNETGSQPYMLTLPECSSKCTLDKFIEITKEWIPDDYAKECQVAWFQKLFTYNKAIVTILICIVLLLIFAVLVNYVLFGVLGKYASKYELL